MSTYENAPTHCAACGRALVDAVSVETGMGPDCREKYGYGEMVGAPDWTKVAELTANAVAILPGDAHGTANKLVHAVACGKSVGPCVAALDALGFGKLAARLGERAHAVRIEETAPGVLTVRAPFSPEFNAALRAVPGQRWVPNASGKGGVRTVPTSSRAALWSALKRAFPAGTTVFGTKGAAVL